MSVSDSHVYPARFFSLFPLPSNITRSDFRCFELPYLPHAVYTNLSTSISYTTQSHQDPIVTPTNHPFDSMYSNPYHTNLHPGCFLLLEDRRPHHTQPLSLQQPDKSSHGIHRPRPPITTAPSSARGRIVARAIGRVPVAGPGWTRLSILSRVWRYGRVSSTTYLTLPQHLHTV